MAIAVQTPAGYRAYVWDWATMKTEAMLPTYILGSKAAFSPDMRYLLTYSSGRVDGSTVYWLDLHEIKTGRMPSRWKLSSRDRMMPS